MKRHAPEGLLLLSAAAAALAAVLGAAVGTRAGIAVLGVALTLGMTGLAWTARRVRRLVEGLGALTEAAHETRRLVREGHRDGRKVERRTRGLPRRTQRLLTRTVTLKRRQASAARRLEQVDKRVQQARAQSVRDATRTHNTLDMVASDAVRLTRLVTRVAPGTDPLPGLGGWAVTPTTLLDMVDEVDRRSGPVTVVECGSGSSTLLLALVLRDRGQGGRVVALESDARFAEETRGRLRHYGVDDLATVVDAPLVDVGLPDGTTQPWFDLAGLPDTGPVDLLFVDGPVGKTAELARYPALPMLGGRLAPGAWVVLDDTNRPDEQRILKRWLAEDHGARLSVDRGNGRSTMLRVS